MIQMRRRGFLSGLGAMLAAPAIIRTPGLIMPVRPMIKARQIGVTYMGFETVMPTGQLGDLSELWRAIEVSIYGEHPLLPLLFRNQPSAG